MSEPLTPEEEQVIRDRMDVWSEYGPDPTETIVRLLATLDATRAAAQERGLDVGALARAIQWDETPIGAYMPPIQPFWDRAARIAREYAAALIEKRGAES